ncbi:MAG: biosynthetic-type acetolactate synthase large subunit [Planctomycetota bacterium]
MTSSTGPRPRRATRISGADLIVQALRDEGVEIIFGYPGAAVVPLMDALYDEPTPAVRSSRTPHLRPTDPASNVQPTTDSPAPLARERQAQKDATMTQTATNAEALAARLENASGAKIFHEVLKDEGVEVLFGYPGGAVIPIFDEIYESPIEFVLTRHEQGAAHMADGYARATGKVGVCLATSGPGALNLVTGLATAHMDSIPVVAITGQVKSHLIGNDAFQEADVTGVTRPITKHNYLVKNVEDIGRIIREAFHLARTGRPGPVLVDIAVDATVNTVEGKPDLEIRLPGYKPLTTGHSRQIKAAAEAINESKRPLLYVGGGVLLANASEELRAVMAKGTLPATTTLLGLGAVDEIDDPLSLRMLGMHGSAAANYAVQECDLLIAVGSRFDDRVTGNLDTFAPHAKIVHMDVDPASISKTVHVDVPVVGDAKDILTKLVNYIEPIERTEWLERVKELKDRYPFVFDKSPEGRIKPQHVIQLVGEMTDHDAIVATGVGQHQMWAAQFYGFRQPRQILTSGGLGTMGYGVPAAIGAAFGHPDKTVIDIDGDGSFTMTMIEVITAVQHKLPVKFIVLDNGYLGMVRQWQELFYDRRYSGVVHTCPDLSKVSEGFGARGIFVETEDQLEPGLRAMLDHDGPAVFVAHVEREENVFPMVPAGKGLHEMELGKLA